MARSRFSNAEEESQKVDIRIRNSEAKSQNAMPKKLLWYCSTYVFLAILAVIMLSAWMLRKNGGFAWMNEAMASGAVNYHGMFMVLGFVVFSGIGDLLYRMFRTSPKLSVKIAHGVVQIIGFAFIVTALCSIFWWHGVRGVRHLTTVHGIIGFIVVLLMALQWTVGFLGFLLPGFKPSVRAGYLPLHQFTGRLIFVLSLAVILIGLNKVGEGATVINVLALVIVLFGLNGGYLLAKDAYARPPVPVGYEVIEHHEERRASLHSRPSGASLRRDVERPEAVQGGYINIAGVGGTYQSMGEDPAVKEALATGRDTFTRFQERLEKKKGLDLPGEFTTTTTVTDT